MLFIKLLCGRLPGATPNTPNHPNFCIFHHLSHLCHYTETSNLVYKLIVPTLCLIPPLLTNYYYYYYYFFRPWYFILS